MALNFRKVTIEDERIFLDYFEKNAIPSEYVSFVTVFAWDKLLNYDFAEKDGEIYLRFVSRSKKKEYYFLPQSSETSIKKAVDTILQEDSSPSFININEEQKIILEKLYSGRFNYIRNRDGDNYVYTSESLASLSGKKLHSKKNRLNKFKKTYSYEYMTMTDEHIEECLKVSQMWCERKCLQDNDRADETACEEVLKNLNRLSNVKGGIIKCDGKIIAFSLGERVSDDMVIIHFEKADTDYDGVYAAINNEFVLNEWMDVKYINREEDMGIEGLRKAKLSYCPCQMIETYIAENNV